MTRILLAIAMAAAAPCASAQTDRLFEVAAVAQFDEPALACP